MWKYIRVKLKKKFRRQLKTINSGWYKIFKMTLKMQKELNEQKILC